MIQMRAVVLAVAILSIIITTWSCPEQKDDLLFWILTDTSKPIPGPTPLCSHQFYTDPSLAPANRIDVVMIGDGYTAPELLKFENDARKILNYMMGQEPFSDYCEYFNFHLVSAASPQSGADHPENSSFVDTLFDATYNCASIQRLICVDNSKVWNYLSSNTTLNGATQQDIIIVIVNDSEYGGSGGALSVASTHSDSADIAVHEMGHSFGWLADEYAYGSCNNSSEPTQVNVTIQTDPSLIKWKHWIDDGTNIPTLSTAAGIPGLYEGGKYCPTGIYRPTYNSKMRQLYRPFEAINEEQLIKKIYSHVTPLDSSSPLSGSIVLNSGDIQNFTIQTLPTTEGQNFEVTWYLDGTLHIDSSNLNSFTLDSSLYTPGAYTLRADIHDKTLKVRSDPTNLLKDSRTWSITIN